MDQTVETEDRMEIIDPDFSKTTEGTISKKTLGNMEDTTVEEITEIIDVMVTIEVGIDQGKDHFQGIEVQAILDQDHDLQLLLIETKYNSIIVESMIILQGIVPLLEKRET